jgi:hypothetical protein
MGTTKDQAEECEELARQGLLRTLARLAGELHEAVDEGLDAEALHDVISLWEANNLNEDLSFAAMVRGGEPTPCDDCSRDVTPYDEFGYPEEDGWEWYMVSAPVWKAATGQGPPPSILCIGCLEVRIGRTLTSADFADVPLNGPHNIRSQRLATRLGRGPESTASTA